MELLRLLLAIILQVGFLPLASSLPHFLTRRDDKTIAPKVMIISMVWMLQGHPSGLAL